MDANPNTAATSAHDRHAAACQLHQAELALHDAHQTRVDAWIAAAADRLHDAVVCYIGAVNALSGNSIAGSPTAA